MNVNANASLKGSMEGTMGARHSPRRALVTAGTSGLGQAICRHLLSQEYTVFIHGQTNVAAMDGLLRDFPRARAVFADLSVAAGREALVARVLEETGETSETSETSETGETGGGGETSGETDEVCEAGLDLLVNNLGLYPEVVLPDIELEVWERTLATTCTAAFHLTQRFLPALERSGKGRIVNIGDSGADRIEARALATPYHIAKVGLHILTRSYAQVLGPRGITVNMISPGFLENSVGDPGEPIPLGRLGRFDDILGALDFVLSDRGAYVSGANIAVSGAWNLG